MAAYTRAIAFIFATSLTGCELVAGIEETTLEAQPGQQTDVMLRGTAFGMRTTVRLRLIHNDGEAQFDIREDGAFIIPIALRVGDAYEFSLVDASPCVINNATGVIDDSPATVELVCEDALHLSTLQVSSLRSQPALSPDRIDYDLNVSLLQQDVAITAIPAYPEALITVAGVPVASGVASGPIELGLGQNIIDVIVTNPSGETRTYELTLRRAAELAQSTYVKASNTDVDDRFGYKVAISGDTIAVGAVGESNTRNDADSNADDNATPASGAVYMFRRSGTSWQQEAYLKAPNIDAADQFGYSIALWNDTLAVGAPYEDSAANGVYGDPNNNQSPNSGAVYVFRRVGTSWNQEAYLKASNPTPDDQFGFRVTLSGETLAVTALYEDSAAKGPNGDQDNNAAADSGAVYVFYRNDSTWAQQAYLKASNTDTDDLFGYSLSLSGETLAVGARHEDSGASGLNAEEDNNTAGASGAAYVFRRTGASWAQEAYIKASNTDAGDQFGFSVALSGDMLAVGAPFEDSDAVGVGGDGGNNRGFKSGAVYIFRRAYSNWAQTAYVKSSNSDSEDFFGSSMALHGRLLAVGAPLEDSGTVGSQDDNSMKDSGAAYVFHFDGANWAQKAYLKASNTDENEYFGDAVAFSDNTLVIGAEAEDSAATGINREQTDNTAANSGAAYLFD